MCNEAYRLLAFYNSNESSASTHICKLPSRYNLAYSSGSSTASEVNAQSDPGVVFKFFSASQQSMRSIVGKGLFDFPKPLALLKQIVEIATVKDSLVLDFFSGSATTAHAVMQLNAEDGGHRKFIKRRNSNSLCLALCVPRGRNAPVGRF